MEAIEDFEQQHLVRLVLLPKSILAAVTASHKYLTISCMSREITLEPQTVLSKQALHFRRERRPLLRFRLAGLEPLRPKTFTILCFLIVILLRMEPGSTRCMSLT